MRQIDQMTSQELDTLHLKGMLAEKPRKHCKVCGHSPRDMVTDCAGFEGKTHGRIINGKCRPCAEGFAMLYADKLAEACAAYVRARNDGGVSMADLSSIADRKIREALATYESEVRQ